MKIPIDRDIVESCVAAVADAEINTCSKEKRYRLEKLHNLLVAILKDNPDDYACDLYPSSYEITMALVRQKQWTLEILDMLIEYTSDYVKTSSDCARLNKHASTLKAKMVGEE